MARGAPTRTFLTDAEYEALATFRHELRRFLAFSEAAALAAGLKPQQHQALLAIRGHRDRSMTIGQLSEQLLIRHHSAVEMADRLSQAGLLRRESDPADRRRVRLLLTPQAESVLSELSATHRDELRRLRPTMLELLGSLNEPDGASGT